MKTSIFAATAAIALCAGATVGATELRLGMSAPEQTPWGAAANAVAARVAELSGGDLTLSVYFNNELGDGQTMARQLGRGRLDMAMLSNVEASLLLPEFGLLNAPYLFTDLAETDCVMDNYLATTFDAGFEAAGAVFLAPFDVGAMQIFARRAYLTPADIASESIRTSPAPTDTYFIQAAGAAAVPLGVPDTMPALRTGTVVGITTPIIMGVAGGYFSEAPEITMTNHSYQIGALLISRRTWDGLSDAQRDALREGVGAMTGLRAQVRGAEQALLARAEGAGAHVNTLSADDLAAWREAVAAALPDIVASVGAGGDAAWASLQEARAQCAQ
ncbi:MAG: TRAP transporter substrate-binding protein [Rhodobacteraceae bacterium]|nr:TRAP transporter substrate-binding protein [Paracoccaceae bacterium]